MKAVIPLLLLSTVLILTGCHTSNLYLRAGVSSRPKFVDRSDPVYVTNPELKQEFEILRISRIFQLTNSPSGNRTLTLHPLAHRGGCGNPLLLTAFTLGIVPGSPAGGFYFFNYDLESNGKVENRCRLLVRVRTCLDLGESNTAKREQSSGQSPGSFQHP